MIEHNFKHTAVVRRKATTSDGGGGFTEVWSDYLSIKAAIRQLNSSEVYRNEARGLNTTHRLYTPIADIKDGDRVVMNGVTYEVKGKPNNPHQLNQFLQIELNELT